MIKNYVSLLQDMTQNIVKELEDLSNSSTDCVDALLNEKISVVLVNSLTLYCEFIMSPALSQRSSLAKEVFVSHIDFILSMCERVHQETNRGKNADTTSRERIAVYPTDKSKLSDILKVYIKKNIATQHTFQDVFVKLCRSCVPIFDNKDTMKILKNIFHKIQPNSSMYEKDADLGPIYKALVKVILKIRANEEMLSERKEFINILRDSIAKDSIMGVDQKEELRKQLMDNKIEGEYV